MPTSVLRRIALASLLVVLGILLCAGIVTGSTGYPSRIDRHVNDYAGVLSEPSKDTIRGMFQKLESDSGIEAVVVTVNSIQDYGTGEGSIDSFATNLFNTWGIGDGSKDNGILILVAVRDKACSIRLGSGYGHQYDSAMQQVIDEHMIPYFKSGDYQTGIIEGSRNAIDEVNSKLTLPSGEEVVSWISKHKWLIVAIVIGLIAVWVLWTLFRRSRVGRWLTDEDHDQNLGESDGHYDHHHTHSRYYGGGSGHSGSSGSSGGGSSHSSGGGSSHGGGASGKW